MDSELVRSFFITRQMDSQFRGQVTDGLCLPILELLVRSGHTILGFRYVRLDDSGKILERAANYRAPGRFGNKGLEIEFRRDIDQSVHKLFYFSANLSDDYLRENRSFLSFLPTLQGCTTFLKATSYMLHQQGFSLIRKEVLERAPPFSRTTRAFPTTSTSRRIGGCSCMGSTFTPTAASATWCSRTCRRPTRRKPPGRSPSESATDLGMFPPIFFLLPG